MEGTELQVMARGEGLRRERGREREDANVDARSRDAIEVREGSAAGVGGSARRDIGSQNMADMFDLEGLPSLELPAPVIPTPELHLPSPRVTSFQPLPIPSLLQLASPHLVPGTPRTRFDLSANSPALLPNNSGFHPLRPILSTTNLVASPHSPFARPTELDISDANIAYPASPRREAVILENDDDDYPDIDIIDDPEPRTPHPLFTPAVLRRQRRQASRAGRSVASGRTARSVKSARSFVKSAWRSVRRSRRAHRTETILSFGGGGGIGVSAMSAASSGSSSSSSRSNSTWNGWKFWKNSSAGGGSSTSGSSDSEDDWEPPTPQFTLLTPYLARASTSTAAYPSHLRHGERGATAAAGERVMPIFELVSSSTIHPTLERLQAFWAERRQEDSLSGDIGAGATLSESEARSGSPQHQSKAESPSETSNTSKAAAGAAGVKMSKGEEKAAKAEEMRGSKSGHPPAWWYDISCPTVSDMRELRKILPLHPLTMEDILQQETREKIETFPSLGYYFIIFRALDETYYKYTSPVTPPANIENLAAASEAANTVGASMQAVEEESKSIGGRARGRVDIVERVGGKEGVEGVGVGAVNLYIVVFADGIVSFHFEDVSKHLEKVQSRIQRFGLTRVMSADWIAYNLMDSVVDTFFPLIDFIEQESTEVDDFLASPFASQVDSRQSKANELVSRFKSFVQSFREKRKSSRNSTEDRLPSSTSLSHGAVHHAIDSFEIIEMHKMITVQEARRRSLIVPPMFWIPHFLQRKLSRWMPTSTSALECTMLVDAKGFAVSPLHAASSSPSSSSGEFKPSSPSPAALRKAVKADNGIDRAKMLKTIADTRKLITGLSRMLTPKTEVVRGLRKRTKEEGLLGVARRGDSLLDIETYLGDLSDHIIAMQQTLVFYDGTLAHQHPAFIGILRVSLLRTKHEIDVALIKLYIIALTILPMNVLIGLFSLNVNEPTEGMRYTHQISEDDDTPAGFGLFYIVLGGVILVAFCTWTIVWVIFLFSKRAMKKRNELAR